MISHEVSFFCVTFVSESKIIEARELSTRENYIVYVPVNQLWRLHAFKKKQKNIMQFKSL